MILTIDLLSESPFSMIHLLLFGEVTSRYTPSKYEHAKVDVYLFHVRPCFSPMSMGCVNRGK